MRTPSLILAAMHHNRSPAEPCWLAIRLPHLVLDLHTRGQRERRIPVAVSDVVQRRERIIDCNPAARAGGVAPGMLLTAARSVLGELHVVQRDLAAERRALERLAAWCYQYSSQVGILADRAGLLLEAGASERLFGAPEHLGRRLVRELGGLGYHAAAGSAATPEAAWLAAGDGRHIAATGCIRRDLGATPLGDLQLEPGQAATMERMGFRRLRDLLRLPKRDLTRRFGPAVPDYLDRLLGRDHGVVVLLLPGSVVGDGAHRATFSRSRDMRASATTASVASADSFAPWDKRRTR